MSYHYKCPRCFNEKGQPGKTFAGHDQELMKKSLPESLVLEFPAILTHSSAISNDIMDIMQSCFSNGMGSTPFTNMLMMFTYKKTQHYQIYIYISSGRVTKTTRKK